MQNCWIKKPTKANGLEKALDDKILQGSVLGQFLAKHRLGLKAQEAKPASSMCSKEN